ncbi:cytochrome c-type biogenesis protein CcmH [Deinococcus aerius]|uniref:Cytochrome c-type biogenesis protein n=2 Tax=Deinococcus TaxID=1298 RepID=A0A2I9D368_9DEIO|nr:cytochrome c-type biogenesis protein CcmH [Deinococcus metallilatus]GBF04610.1 cytochrome c-type biogenesis protein CcmH [Deinococcus aerius]MBB5293930.1 cytochrome c-type biogenesis protein CcmH [Deinococcus metallilatus]QBY07134.1 cytochrome c-type biogenesis protein CcmH [Deinococcus metallilatus]RXJ14606.1 cytochrome c-type biogenesis protein CcmH [Deinococcus metallilatus]TLK30726.1 cytochrome c-type biogenesis protein CcmH [Deinococcus metallilatus]
MWGLLALVLGLLLSVSLALTPDQEARAERLGTNLRCPICTGLPITESTNDLSREMLRDVREQVVAGRSDRDIYAYFAARYGNFVLLDPPKEGSNLLLWGAPLAALVAGGAVLWGVLRKRNVAAPSIPEAGTEAPFDPFLAQVRRETRGDDRAGGQA